jgi:hypothetical protein
MDSEIMDKWLAYWCPLQMGLTPNGHANALVLTQGTFWARAAGGYNLYRWTGSETPVQTDRVIGAASAGARQVSNFPFITHEPSTVYWYLLRAVGGGGVEESTTHQLRRVAFDADGDMIGSRPNSPGHLSVDSLSGGRFCLRWAYEPTGQEVSPGSFDIYNDDGSPGQVDYTTAAGSVDYAIGRSLFEWTSDAFSDGTIVWWSVRAKSPDGVLEDNTVTVAGRADATGPAVHSSVTGTRTEDTP